MTDTLDQPGTDGSAGLEAAAHACREAVARDPENPILLHRLGGIMGQLGQTDLELALIGQAIARAPDNAGYHSDLGYALLAAGLQGDARESFVEALRLEPGLVDARSGLADLLLDEGRIDEARSHVTTAALGRRGRRVLGRLALNDQDWPAATDHLLAALTENPIDPPGLFYLGVALQARELFEPAAAAYHQAVAVDPRLFEARANLATVLTTLGRNAEALVHADAAVALAPDRPGALLNRANAHRDCGDLAAALADLERAVSLAPDYAEAWSTLGNLYHDLGEMSRALEAHRQAVTVAPDLAQARWNRSFTLLATGQLEEGWDEYEWRKLTAAARPEARPFGWPTWTGEPLAGKRLLVWREQGLGDELLFLTCLVDLVEAGAAITLLASPRLVELVRRSFPTIRVEPDGAPIDQLGSFDYQIGLASVPRRTRRARTAFPTTGTYLRPDPNQVDKWRDRLDQLGPGVKVGLCWRSGLITPERRRHYANLTEYRPLLDARGVTWVNLQYDECQAELAEIELLTGIKLHSWEGEDLRNDLESVAGLIAGLDAVVSAPTAVGSLAGALGQPTWQVDSGSDWTTFGERRSPWFPTIDVVTRRPADSSWDRVLGEIRMALEGLKFSGGGADNLG